MDVSSLIRDSAKVQSTLQEVGNDLIAIKPCKVYFPEHYIGTELGSMDGVIKVLGMFGITVDDTYYAVSKACALIETDPSIINTVVVGNIKYMEFSYAVGDKVIKNLNLLRSGTLVYRIYNEFITNGKIPWYFSYEDLGFIFDTALVHGNANLYTDSAMLELLAASMARQRDDKFQFFRHDARLQASITEVLTPVFVALKSVAFGATNTMAKLMGNYFSEGVTSALTTNSTSNESIEDLIRG